MNKRIGMALVVVCAVDALAQESVKSNQTEIVVTATRQWTEAARTPVSISVITSQEIEQKGANNLSDVLHDVPGVYIRSLNGGPAAEVAMRGGGENSQGRVLVLLDGHRLNNLDMASMNWLQIPLNLVDRVEVLRGSQNALYGDFASQGVINIITKKGSAKPRTDMALIAGSYDTFVARAGTSGSAGTEQPVTYTANAEWESSDGYRDRSGYESYGAGGRIGYDFTGDAGMSLVGSWYRSDYELPGSLTRAEMRDDPKQSHNPDDKTDNDYLNVGADFFSEPSEGCLLDANLGWSGKKTKSDVVSWFMFSDTELNSFSAQPKASLESDLAGMDQRTTLGVDAYFDRFSVDRYSDQAHTTKTIAADLDKQTLGVYARHQVELTPQWILNGGGRLEQAHLSADAHSGGVQVVDDSQTRHGNAWELGLTYAFEPGCKAFTRVNSVYRYPFVDEQISYYGFGSDSFYRELEPEKGLNAEAGLELGGSPDWRANVTVFRLEMRDEVAWDPVENRNANLDETRRQGVELYGSWKPVALVELLASYTYTEAEFTSGPNDGKKVPLVPLHVSSGTVKLDLPLDLNLATTVYHAGSSPLGGDVANAGDKLDAYTTLAMMVHYQPTGKSYSAFVGVENVTDESYATVAYQGFSEDGYYPANGRNWRVGVNLTF